MHSAFAFYSWMQVMLTMLMLGCVGTSTSINGGTAQSGNVIVTVAGRINYYQESEFQQNVKMVNDRDPLTRVTGIILLGSYWDQNKNSKINERIAGTVVQRLEDDNDNVRRVAAEVIGLAITKPCKEITPLVELIYGNGYTGTLGLVNQVQYHLLEKRQRVTSQAEIQEIEDKLKATREAIRKNWECLCRVNLRALDLAGIELYDSDLRYANLAGANLNYANLNGANIAGAAGLELLDKIEYANLHGLKGAPNSFVQQALAKKRAVDMDLESWWRWKRINHPLPSNWNDWRKNRFQVDNDGNPLCINGTGSLPGLSICPTRVRQ